MAEKTNTGLVEYAKAQLGLPYWYGTFGQIGTAALYQEKKRQYPNQYPPQKWTEESFKIQYGQRVTDCAGLVKGYMFSETPTSAPVYNPKYDLSANGMMAACDQSGKIENIPEVPGLIVWKNNHVGIYITGGKVIEAKGHAYGVIQSRISDTKWVQYGWLPWIKYQDTPTPAPSKFCEVTAPILRRGDKNTSVRRLQGILNTSGAGLDVDGSFGPATEKAVKARQEALGISNDGVVGRDSWSAFLQN